MREKSWGALLVLLGILNLSALVAGSVISHRTWPGMLLLGVPVLLISAGGGNSCQGGDRGEVLGVLSAATFVQGLLCAITCVTFCVWADIGLILLGFVAIMHPLDSMDDDTYTHSPRHKRPRNRRRRRTVRQSNW